MKRIPLLIIVVTLLSFSSFSVANPGGVGDGDFDRIQKCGWGDGAALCGAAGVDGGRRGVVGVWC